ncbi:MAG: precorrin-6A reductase [Marinobacterium sp.]|nr:precorrin-6A reductase [Marinobacterium sp.]
MNKLLLLGGTADARRIATALHQAGVELVYSIAGLVRTPQIGCEVRVGGFTQSGGLGAYLREQQICAVLDVTHPYAAKMSSTAVTACADVGIPCWRFHRSAWPEQGNWVTLDNWQTLPQQLSPFSSVLLTAGQLELSLLTQIAASVSQVHLRTAVEPGYVLPANVNWIKAIGPFAVDDERALMRWLNVQALVSKNSGGSSTAAKLVVAQERAIPVFMLLRPELPVADCEFSDTPACIEFITAALL